MAKTPTKPNHAAAEAAPSPASRPAWIREVLTHAGILLAFFLFVTLYFKPLVFDGKVSKQSDIVQFTGMAKESRDFKSATGEEAMWVSSMFGGMPGYQIATGFPENFFTPINKALWMGLPRPANYVWVYFLGFFLLLRVLKVNPWLSGIGAAAFALSSYFFIILEAGHTSKANAISFMAPLLAGIILAYQGRLLLGGAMAAFFTALQLTANHYQITYYLVILIGIMAIGYFLDAILQKQLKGFFIASGVLLLAALLGVLPNAGRLLTTQEYAAETMRGPSELQQLPGGATSGLDKEYALRWSYGVGESFTLLVPNFYGGASGTEVDRKSELYKDVMRDFGGSPEGRQQVQQLLANFPTYWGDQPFTSGPVYVGALVCMLFLLGALVVKGGLKWGLIAASLLMLMLSWGRNFAPLTDLFFAVVPGYNKFRAVAMTLVMVELAMPLLGFLGLQHIMGLQSPDEKNAAFRKLLIAGGITGGLALIFALIGPGLFSFSNPTVDGNFPAQLTEMLEDYRKSMFRSDAFRSLFFIALGFGAIALYLKNRIQPWVVYTALGVLVFIDMVPVNYRYLGEDAFVRKNQYESQFAPTPANQFILSNDQDPNFRVLNIASSTFNDALTSYHHKSIGGYHAAKLRRYQDLIDSVLTPEITQIIGVLNNQPTDSSIQAMFGNLKALNMLNMRYLIYNPQAQPIRNTEGYGHAWFVSSLKKVQTPDEELISLRSTDLQSTVVVDESKFGAQLNGFTPANDTTAIIALKYWSPNKLEYNSTASTEQVAVFSEVYYNQGKGWKAYIDGKPAEHFRANYVLRAMRVPAGTHTIEFRMEPESYFLGRKIDLIGSIIVLLAVAAALFLEWRNRRQNA